MGTLYLLTGAAGHLGAALVRQLLAEGKKVRALVVPQEPTIPDGIEIFRGDVRDRAGLEPFFHNPDGDDLIVIHAAGIVSIASKFDPLVYDVNVGGTRNIVDCCARHRVKKLVYVSSVHAIPEGTPGTVIRETADFSPDAVVGLYAKTKAEATAWVLDAARQGLNASVVHPSGICGPYDNGRGHLTTLIIDYCNRRLTSLVKGGYDFVDVRDVAAGILACCERGEPGECYILSNRYFTVQKLIGLLSEITGRRMIRHVLPLWFARLTAPLAELYYKLMRQPPLFTRYSLYTLQCNAGFSHAKADAALGYTTTDMRKTLADTIDWLAGAGRISALKPRARPGARRRRLKGQSG